MTPASEPTPSGRRSLLREARHGFRVMAKHPRFALLAIATLGLGLGTVSAVFALVQGALLSPPPYAAPARLVLVGPARLDGKPYNRGLSTGQWADWRRNAKSLEGLALYRWTFNFLVLPEGSHSIEGMVVTPGYFEVLGLHPARGRGFRDGDAAGPNSGPTSVVLGDSLWRTRFQADPDIVGKAITISRMPSPITVVGVMPPGVRFLPDPGNSSEPNYDLNAPVDFWLCATPDETKPKEGDWSAVGRLLPGVSLAQAGAELAILAGREAAADSDLSGITARLRPVQAALNVEGERVLFPLLGAVALVFLIACGNVAGLLLARGLQRQSEFAMRAALGAGRRRLFTQVLTETLILAAAGALLGAGVAAGAIKLFKVIGARAIPRLDSVAVGWPLFGFLCVLALAATALAGLLPAVRASRVDLVQAIRGGRTTSSRGDLRLLRAIAMAQTALTLALLAGAALLLRTAANLAAVQPGFQADRLLTATVTAVGGDRYKEFHTLALERVGALPGVKQAAFGWGLPLTGNKWTAEVELPDRTAASRLTDKIQTPLRSVSQDYFAALGIRLAEGRGFRAGDDGDAKRVAIVNQTFANTYFSGGRAVGRNFQFAGDTNHPVEIVGIIADTRTDDLSRPPEPELYLPFWQSGAYSKHLVVRTSADPRSLISGITREIHGIDPTASVEHFQTMDQVLSDSIAPQTFAMRLLAGLACAAVALAMVGIYGVLSLSVASRTREIAVRVAVGAQRGEILRLILGQGLGLIGAGLAVGLVIALALGRLLGALLFNVRPADPGALGAAGLLLACAGLAACWLPARRAAWVDPVVALRGE